MQKRTLGRTGESISVIGFGGVLLWEADQATSDRLVAQAVDRGVTWFDVAPTYGYAQKRLGPALETYRGSAFLACKTIARTKAEAWAHLEESLRQLRTDHFDLYQLHGVDKLEEVDRVTAPDGALETLVEARDRGLVRYLGFSSHCEQAALALMDRFDFDTVMYPVNWGCWHQGNLGPGVVEKASAKRMGILGLKALVKRKSKEGEPKAWPRCWYTPVLTREEVTMGIRFALSQPITAAIPAGHAEHLWWACDAADVFEPLTREEHAALANSGKGLEPLFRNDPVANAP
jgi:aryl-alcohol dehydrogenase-like predicted oxidoreductase